MKRKFSILKRVGLFILLAIIAVVFYFIGQKTAYTGINSPYFALPASYGINTGNYACVGTVIASLNANGKNGVGSSGIDASTSDNDKDLDKIDIQVSDDGAGSTLKLATSVPNVDVPVYTITENDNNILSAYYMSKGTWGEIDKNITAIDIFTLNKKTGIAIWSYLSPQNLLTSNPGGFMEYLGCN